MIEVDLLGLDELCATIPSTRPLPPDSGQQDNEHTTDIPTPDVIFPPDGGLCGGFTTKAPPKLQIPAGVEPGKRFRTSFDGHAILTVTEITPGPPDMCRCHNRHWTHPSVVVLSCWRSCGSHAEWQGVVLQQRVLETAPLSQMDEATPTAGDTKRHLWGSLLLPWT